LLIRVFERSSIPNQIALIPPSLINGKPFRDVLFYGTEGTEHQAKMYSHLFPLMREGGMRAIWFGIEDLSKTLINKGQSAEKTIEVFRKMRENGISPMTMMMHFQGQPLKGDPEKLDGILDQIKFLKRNGASTVQITYNGPSIGSRDYKENHFDKGIVLKNVGGLPVDHYLYDGNHVISTPEENVLERQDNLMRCYESFYNIGNFTKASWNYFKARVSGDGRAQDIAGVELAFQFGAIKALRLSKRNVKEWRKALASGHDNFEYHQGAPESSIQIVQASEYNSQSVVESKLESASYESHASSLYDRFVQGAEQFIDKHRGDIDSARERLYDMASGIMTREGERLSKLGEGAGKLRDDLRDKLHSYIDSKFPVIS